ncbi:MAG: UvrB/UvrC motif-containing protein, partial [Candidatus Parcubacteria bacterium]|nr:UvrB/UvrC motif-containing protein [Candidatus Parcubacteria bacterium]
MENFKITGKEKISFLPKTPGVYCFKNSAGSFLYIGKAANLRARVKNHFFQPSYRDNFFISQVAKIGYIKTKSEIEALILEANLIKRYEPKFNVIWRDDKQYFFVGFASPNPPGAEKAGFINLPVVFLTHQPNAAVKFKNTAQYIGPFTEGKPLKKILRFLRKIFPYYSQANHPKKLCPYCHLGLCPGPTPDEKKYRRNILKLKAILKGKQKKVLRDIKKEMKLAGEKEDFEKAGEIRDQIKSLENIFEHSKIIIPEKDHIWSEAEKNLKALLETNQKISRIEAYDISDIQGQEATASMITF